MKKLSFVAFLLGLFFMMGAVVAADKDDPTGTWKYKVKFGKNEVEQTLKLEQKDGKLTGTVSGAKGEPTKIEDGTFKDGEVSFTVTRVFGKDKDKKAVSKFSGKLSGDSIKGSIATDFGGKENKADWEATREKKKD
jgi:hypothetical protein